MSRKKGEIELSVESMNHHVQPRGSREVKATATAHPRPARPDAGSSDPTTGWCGRRGTLPLCGSAAPPANLLRARWRAPAWLSGQTPLGRGESPGRGSGTPACASGGTPTWRGAARSPSRRHGTPGPRPEQRPADRPPATPCNNRPHTHPNTTPRHSRACRRDPRHSAGSDRSAPCRRNRPAPRSSSNPDTSHLEELYLLGPRETAPRLSSNPDTSLSPWHRQCCRTPPGPRGHCRSSSGSSSRRGRRIPIRPRSVAGRFSLPSGSAKQGMPARRSSSR